MNLGAVLIMLKLVGDTGVLSTEVGPPPPPSEIPSLCYTTKGKLTWLCYLKYVDPAASYNDYQDYLKGI